MRPQLIVTSVPTGISDKEPLRDVGRKANASMGCGIIWDHPRVHTEIEAIKPHEKWHLHVIDRGAMIAVFVRNHVLTCGRIESTAPGGDWSVQNRHAILDHRRPLSCEGDFNAQLLRIRTPAKKHLDALHVPGVRGKIKREHFVAPGLQSLISSGGQQSANVLRLAQPGRNHERCDSGIAAGVSAEIFGFQKRDERLLHRRGQDDVQIRSRREECLEDSRVVCRDGLREQRNLSVFGGRRRWVAAEQKLDQLRLP